MTGIHQKLGFAFRTEADEVKIFSVCLMKIRCHLIYPVRLIVIYNTKKVCNFSSNKDKIPDLSHSSAVYETTCPGWNKTYR